MLVALLTRYLCAIPIHGSLLQVRDGISYADPVYEYSKYSFSLTLINALCFPESFSSLPFPLPISISSFRFLAGGNLTLHQVSGAKREPSQAKRENHKSPCQLPNAIPESPGRSMASFDNVVRAVVRLHHTNRNPRLGAKKTVYLAIEWPESII
ncbi:hypothetical protein GGI42DRAFT_321623, partial [Trichoderma sp. SZMC 28013]